ncbi:DUF309 domain-containing protein [bacterium]|nr:DUF309 domain-containing protein [bacterium]
MPEYSVPKRLVPEIPFPSYSYVPGEAPHPTRDRDGHSYEEEAEDITLVPAPDPENWQKSKLYLYGIDLFNYGYYWETHEAWEDLWHALGRTGTTANFLKGIIHLAAAGIKAKQGQTGSMQKHARRAAGLLNEIRLKRPKEQPFYMGLDLNELVEWSEGVAENSAAAIKETPTTVDGGVFCFLLEPE